MKTLAAIIFVASTLSLWAQGTLYLSNLGESGTGGSVGGGDQSFVTGTASNGYTLNSITLFMGNWAGNASNFNVSIYNDNSGQAGDFLGALNGNNDPETAGQYLYTASNLILNPNIPYWIVAMCDSWSPGPPLPPGGYTWQLTSSPNYSSSGDWSIGTSSGQLFQFAVDATPVPEPSTFALVGVALGLVVITRCRLFRADHV